jgi:hypothetical protein
MVQVKSKRCLDENLEKVSCLSDRKALKNSESKVNERE